MRRFLLALVVIGLIWLAFEVGREVGRLEVTEGGPGSPSDAGQVQDDSAVREMWRAPAPPTPGTAPLVAIDSGTWADLSPTETDLPEGCGARCGVQRWPVKTLSDPGRADVDFQPVAATIEELGRLPRPTWIPSNGRAPPYETRVYRVTGYLAAVDGQSDGDIHLVLFDLQDQRASLIAEIPDPQCAGACRSGFAGRYAAARAALAEGLERLARTGSDAPVVVEVIGVGFFDHSHGQVGAAPNYFELHPVLALRFVP